MIKTKFTVSGARRKTFASAIEKAARIELSKRFKNVNSAIVNAVNDSIKENSAQFIPTNQQAIKLGVGQSGRVDNSRAQGAWRELLVGGNITTLQVREGRGNTLGSIAISIDVDKFFKANLSKVSDADSGISQEIPWMRWFIKGSPAIQDFKFIERSSEPVSRIGAGRIVFSPGAMWHFPPAQPLAIDNLIKKIRSRVISTVKNNIGKL